MNQFDLLYIFNYESLQIKDAISRLRCSMRSIATQDVNVCIANYSSECIKAALVDLKIPFQYLHKPYSGLFSKSLFINHAVKHFVRTSYFILSDVDLVYSQEHIERLINHIGYLNLKGNKVRYVTYNYNLAPLIKNKAFILLSRIPFVNSFINLDFLCMPHQYTHDYAVLDRMPKLNGGFAHGPGLIHTETFFLINGYDEELIGHGPEDDMFNTRIGKVNRLIYDNSPALATFHLWHPKLRRIQVQQNLKIWAEKKAYLDSLVDPTYDDVKANVEKKNWGIIN